MKSSQELVFEYNGLKQEIEKVVRKGTQFIFKYMNNGQVPSYNHEIKQYGIWPSAEMAEFLLSNQILPKACSNRIDTIIDFLLSNFKSFSNGTGAWIATVNGTTEYFSALVTGYCTYVLKLYYNDFLDDERGDRIKNVINQAESYIVNKQQDAGFWTPDNSTGEKLSVDGINDSDFFYSYHAYLAIKKLPQYQHNVSRSIENALAAAKSYFKKYASHCITKFKSQKLTDIENGVLLSYISKVLQVLNDFDDADLKSTITELHQISLEIFNVANDNNFFCSHLRLKGVPKEGQGDFHNNTPYDVYFALREEEISAENLFKVIDWYLKHQADIGCWYLNGNEGDTNNTWTTTEALLVLSDAYNMLSEELYLREQQELNEMQKQCDCYKEEIEREKSALSKQNNQLREKLGSYIKLINKRNNIRMGFSVGVSILISIACFVVFLLVVTKGMNSTLETTIVVVILGLAVNAIFQGMLFIWGLVKKQVRKMEEKMDEIWNNFDDKN